MSYAYIYFNTIIMFSKFSNINFYIILDIELRIIMCVLVYDELFQWLVTKFGL